MASLQRALIGAAPGQAWSMGSSRLHVGCSVLRSPLCPHLEERGSCLRGETCCSKGWPQTKRPRRLLNCRQDKTPRHPPGKGLDDASIVRFVPKSHFPPSREYILEEHVANKGHPELPLPKEKEENRRQGRAGSFCSAASFPLPLQLLGMSLKSNAKVPDPEPHCGNQVVDSEANNEIRGTEQSVQDNPDASTPGRCQWARFQRLWDRPGSAHTLRLKRRWGGPGTLSAEPGALCLTGKLEVAQQAQRTDGVTWWQQKHQSH